MQKFLAKYTTAAHLAILAVAPLFLFPFAGDSAAAPALLWLTLFAGIWAVFAPSLRPDEGMRQACRRTLRSVLLDPLFWTLVMLVVAVGVRALNGGVDMVYDAETQRWQLSPGRIPVLPGCVEGRGMLSWSAMAALAVLIPASLHSLGRYASSALLLISSTLAGLAGVVAIAVGAWGGCEAVRSAIVGSATGGLSVGIGFYLHLLGGTLALLSAFEHRWNAAVPLLFLAIGGCAAAGFLFSPAIVSVIFLAAEIALMLAVFGYGIKGLPAAGEFKLLAVMGISVTLGVVTVLFGAPEIAAERWSRIIGFDLLPVDFAAVRECLSRVAAKTWLDSIWIGAGEGSFPLAFRFHAAADDWALLRGGAQSVPHGWWVLLAERGIVGAAFLALPVGFLLFKFVRRLVALVRRRGRLHPAMLAMPLVLAALGTAGVYDCGVLRADVLMVAAMLLAFSVNSFPRSKDRNNG